MKKGILLFVTFVLLSGCQAKQSMYVPGVTATPRVNTPAATEATPDWSVYDPDPEHLWNRVFLQLYRRTASDGIEYGSDALDPLLWFDTTYLLDEGPYGQAIRVLDEFLSTKAETLIADPLKRAMFQRDLWAVFDWLASQSEPYPSQRQALKRRLAQIIRRVALSRDEIASLPDNYALEVEARTFPADVMPDQREGAFLPADLFQADSGWVPIGRAGGPVAMTHTETFPFFGRSVFFVFVRSPDGRAETIDYIESLNAGANPVTVTGTDVALVRRMLLIDVEGNLVISPLVEAIQLRHFRPAQSFHEIELSRSRLLDRVTGGLVLKQDLFMLFMGHGDVFENQVPELRAGIPEICKACHFSNNGNTGSIISYSRQPFALPDNEQPILFPTTLEQEAQTVTSWKRGHVTWRSLEAMWAEISP